VKTAVAPALPGPPTRRSPENRLRSPAAGTVTGHRPWAREAVDVAGAVPLFVTAPLIRPWHTRWGATDAEVGAAMPGDDLVLGCQYRTTRAITITAEPRHVWPWLVQVGCGRAGFYSLDLLDNLGWPSADTLLPQFQHLAVGQWVPMSPTPSEVTAFKVHSFEPQAWLLWVKPDSTWSWRLTNLGDGRTRLVTRIRARYDWSRPLNAALSVLLMEVGDFAMLRRMLRGIQRRAERHAEPHGITTRDVTRSTKRSAGGVRGEAKVLARGLVGRS
jgi:hypothetical protein